jgi:1-deoxy-D-xylulose-5-phosphate reductoisomerase
VLVHRQSIVHSMVELIDGSVIAQMGVTDMRLPIQYACSYPERWDAALPSLDLAGGPTLEFYPPPHERFPCLDLAYRALRTGGTLPVVLNAANEIAVECFWGVGSATSIPRHRRRWRLDATRHGADAGSGPWARGYARAARGLGVTV